MSSLPWAASSPSWPVKCLSSLWPGTTLKSRLPSVTEADQAEAPCPAALGFPTHPLLPLRTGLLVTASLNGICCTKDKAVPLCSLAASKAFACVGSGPWRAAFFSYGGLFRDQLLFPECFCFLGDSMRFSDSNAELGDGAACTSAMTPRGCTHAHCWLFWTSFA